MQVWGGKVTYVGRVSALRWEEAGHSEESAATFWIS